MLYLSWSRSKGMDAGFAAQSRKLLAQHGGSDLIALKLIL